MRSLLAFKCKNYSLKVFIIVVVCVTSKYTLFRWIVQFCQSHICCSANLRSQSAHVSRAQHVVGIWIIQHTILTYLMGTSVNMSVVFFLLSLFPNSWNHVQYLAQPSHSLGRMSATRVWLVAPKSQCHVAYFGLFHRQYLTLEKQMQLCCHI